MKIDGKQIAEKILDNLSIEVTKLKERGVEPTLAVILVGDNPASLSYIKQKQKAAERIGAKIVVSYQPAAFSSQELKSLIEKYNDDPLIHGIIVQRPLPKESNIDPSILNEISPQKDVDGFVPNSPFEVPVAMAVLAILKIVFEIEKAKGTIHEETFESWIKNQCSAVLGRGETAGTPIFKALSGRGCATSIVHSQTQNPKEIIKKMFIVVSCVGKERVITADMLTPESILISVGLWRDTEGKLHGDYEEDEIKDIAAYYTPTPGGVGPVNVACLMQNVVMAAKLS